MPNAPETKAATEIDSMLSERRVFPPPPALSARAHVKSLEQYRALAEEARRDPEGYWAARAREELFWKEPFQTALEWKPPFARWFVEGRPTSRTTASTATRGAQRPALLWEGARRDWRTVTRL